MKQVDAVVVGGGVSGSTTAAALAREGWQVLLVESGLPSEKRLAGELMHPPAAERLQDLGLTDALMEAGAVPVYGFVLLKSAGDPGLMLSYSEVEGLRPTGLCVEHSTLSHTLLDAVEGRRHIEVWRDAKVLDADLDNAQPIVTIRRGEEEVQVQTKLLVSAEGRSSKLREKAGIKVSEGHAFRMVGYRIPGGRLPYPGYGHLFIGGSTPTLAYQMARDEVRIMFELPEGAGLEVPEELLAALPSPLAEDVRAIIAKEKCQSTKVCALVPSAAAAGHLAAVGDSAGCIHPVSASGIAFCTRDAVALAQSLVGATQKTPAQISAALKTYDRERRGPMKTRAALGTALVDALTGHEPGALLLREGLFEYWKKDRVGRRASIAILATADTKMSSMVEQYARVGARGLSGSLSGVVEGKEVPQALSALFRQAASALRGSI